MSRFKKLQVLIEGEWKWVYCRNELKRIPVLTEDDDYAIRVKNGDEKRTLDYFSNHYGNLEFRIWQ